MDWLITEGLRYSSFQQEAWASGWPFGVSASFPDSYPISCPMAVSFFDNSRTKIGLPASQNRITSVLSKTDFDRYYSKISCDLLRINLRSYMFKYPFSAFSFVVADTSKSRRLTGTRSPWSNPPKEDKEVHNDCNTIRFNYLWVFPSDGA